VGGAGLTFSYDDLGAEPLGPDDPRYLGPIALRAVLGSGGMGRVYLGITPTGYAAVKRVLPQLATDKDFIRRFRQELDNQARLPDGVGARVLAADHEAKPPWFAAEYVPGVTVHEAVELAGGRLPAQACWVLAREFAARLAAMAELGIIHRDLKPSNIMLTADGIRLIDFGVARAADQSVVTVTGNVVGTPSFMAPEQANANKSLTPAVDVFSLGAVLTYAATGEPPFGHGGPDVFYRIVHTEPELGALAEVDAALAGVVSACLSKDITKRPTAEAVVEFATDRAPAGPPVWPEPIAAPVMIRSSFAAAPGADVGRSGTPGRAGAADPPAADPLGVGAPGASPSGTAGGLGSWRESGVLRRVAFVVLPLIVAAGAGYAALKLIPGGSPPANANADGPTITQPTVGSSVTRVSTQFGPHHHRRGDPSPSDGPSVSTQASASSTASPTPHRTVTPSPHPSPSHSVVHPPVVSSDYSMIKNVAGAQCVTNSGYDATASACSAATSQGWAVHDQSASGFQLSDNTGYCLFDSGTGYVDTELCTGYGAAGGDWRVGALSSSGGQLVNTNTGKCLTWVNSTYGFSITTKACSDSDPAEFWYDAGRA
jgi:serine/threonine protein kinase